MTAPTEPRAGRKEWIGLVVLSLPCLLYSMDLTVLHLAVPSLTADLKPSGVQLLWIIDIYGFLVAGSLITMGTLGDRIGRRRLLLIGAALFGVASILAAFSPTAETLIISRALLGIAGATVAPSTLSLIRNMFHDPGQRSVAVSVWISAYSLGGVAGPFIGGVLLEFFWWGSVFLIAVPVMVLILVVGPRLLPEYKDPNAGRLDIASAALSIGAVLATILSLKELAQDGISVLPVLALLAGILLGTAFVRRQLSLADPLIDLRLFQNPAFSGSVALYGLTILVLFGTFLFLPQYLQLVRGLPPLRAGLWSIPGSLAFLVGAMITPALAKRIPPAPLMAGGLAVAALGYLAFINLSPSTGLATYVAGSVLLSLGSGPVFTLTNDMIIGAAPPERAGAAAGISETSAEFGGALGIAVYGSIGIAIYRGMLADAPLENVPAPVMDGAMDTLGAAIALSSTLPAPAAAQLVHAAQNAFLAGLRVGVVIGVVGTVALIVFTLSRFRQTGAKPEENPVA